jgi:hypothetical protein
VSETPGAGQTAPPLAEQNPSPEPPPDMSDFKMVEIREGMPPADLQVRNMPPAEVHVRNKGNG